MSGQSFPSTPSGGRLVMIFLGALVTVFAVMLLSGAGFLHRGGRPARRRRLLRDV